MSSTATLPDSPSLPYRPRLPRSLVRAHSLLAVTALALLPAGAAHALMSPDMAGDDAVSTAVVSEKIGEEGDPSGNCTGTAIAPRWVVTARHCVEGSPNVSGSSVRIGQGDKQRVVDVDRWEKAPAGDITLMHTTEDMKLSSYPKIADTVPSSGEVTVYGWSSDGSGGTKTLPKATGSITGIADFTLFDGKQSLSVDLSNGAKTQPGDSGGPVFVGDKVAAVLTASIDENDPEATSSSHFTCTPLAEQYDWITKTISADGGDSGSQTKAKDSHDLNPLWLVGGGVVLLAALGVSFVVIKRGGKNQGADEASTPLATGDNAPRDSEAQTGEPDSDGSPAGES